MIETYLSIDYVPYKCPRCKVERQCEKQFEIVKLPLILTISLGRFYNDGLSRKKQNFVDFEMYDVNLGQYTTGCNGQLNRYKDYHLYGISNHFGSLGKISHKMSPITIFGHKHFRQKFHQNLTFFTKKNFNSL